MSIETPSSAFGTRSGHLVWLILAASITISVILSIWSGHERTVVPAYRVAAQHWLAGEPLYNLQGHGFLYLPQAALTFAPWALLPRSAGEVTWRLAIIAIFALSISSMTKLVNGNGRWYALISISSALLAWGCARNGQSTLVMTALMIMAAADLSESRWWRASLLLSLAFAFKPLALVMMLLVGVIYPRTSWRMVIGLALVALVPFATQRPDYVFAQYSDCLQSLGVTFEVGEAEKWAQLFGMLQVVGLDIPGPARTIVRLVAAVLTLWICWKATRQLSPQRAAFYIYSLSAAYLMLFNPRTEGNTYAMMGPVYGVLLAEALQQGKKGLNLFWMMFSSIVLSVLNYDLAILVTDREDAIWICPLVCLAVTSYLVVRLVNELQSAVAHDDESSDGQTLPFRSVERRAAA